MERRFGGWVYSGAEKGAVPFESERLSEKDLHNEAVMTALRTCEGLSLTDFARRFGPESRDRLLRGVQQYIDRGQAEIVGGTLRITPAGVVFHRRHLGPSVRGRLIRRGGGCA